MSPALHRPDDLRDLLGIPYTEEQIEAITAPLDPGVIVAGAGSGKTAVMAARVVWLVGTGAVGPAEVLGLTFTNKAAGELRERVAAGLARLSGDAGPFDPEAYPSDDAEDEGEPVIATYHAYADALIKEHGLRLGLEPSARLLADANRYTLAARAVRHAEGPFDFLRGSVANLARKVIDLDAELAEHVVEPDRLRGWTAAFTARAESEGLREGGRAPRGYADYWRIARVALERAELLGLVEDYRALKRHGDFVDFGDQMALGTRLAEQVPQVGQIEREKYRVVLLDEYQDTSVAQRRMLAGLFGGGHAVTAVGDPCQSIYGWRGASPSNIDLFPEHFPRRSGAPAAQYALSENRRSGSRLLAFANERSGGLRELHSAVRELRASADKQGRGRAEAAFLETQPEELAWLGERIQGLYDQVRGDWSAIAVLVRAGNQIPDIYAELHGRGVPVEVVGLSGLLHLPEIADLVAVLDVLDDPTANASLVRLLTGPRWRIGPRDLALLGRRARDLVRDPGEERRAGLDEAVLGADPTDVVSLADALADPGGQLPFSQAALARFERCAVEIRRLRRSLAEPVVDVLHRILQETGLEVEIAASSAAYRQRCAETVGAFLAVAGGFTDLEGESSVTAFRAFLKAAAAHERGLDVDLPPAEQKTVKILTMHKAKGLEWEVVALPHQNAAPVRTDKYTANAGKLPHELRGDGDWLPELGPEPNTAAAKRFDLLMREHAGYEDQRVEYVALTRAKSLLLVSGHGWGKTQRKPREANETLAELRERLLADIEFGRVETWAAPPEEGAANPLREAQAEAEWPAPPDSAARAARLGAAAAVRGLMRLPEQARPADEPIEDPRQRRVVEGWDTDLDALLEELRRAQEVRREVRMPASLSATRLLEYVRDRDAFAERLFRPMPRPPVPQARRGTEFHAWVEDRFGQLSLFDEAELDLFGDEDVRPDPAFGEDLDELKASFLRTEYAERPPLRVEAPFQLVLGGRIVRGRIDAVYRLDPERPFGRRRTKHPLDYEVVDWKTGHGHGADPLQLAIYRLAWAELAGVPIERVSAAFLYVRTGEVARPRSLPGRAALEKILRAAP
ncbi:ATP-dependent DNA helicase [Actinospica durhamensis]|uniref:ATP-dependent DNA helicase n=1 Tax=Actinospica durhamensis TaxID=1508375 RepID=UPI001FE555E6|nr:ATP-dependent DNA helicase [Actinospica durhamensis]